MRIESKLCHITENKVIVQVNGWVNDKSVGSALAEAATVELAEDKAIGRLTQRVTLSESNETTIQLSKDINSKYKNNQDDIKKEIKLPSEINKSFSNKLDDIDNKQAHEDVISNNEPSDWSNELAAIDSEIKRLNWSREEELLYLGETFGYNNRNKITKYTELIKYLNNLKMINQVDLGKNHIKNFHKLIDESESLLKELKWDHKKGREYLQKQFNVSTRKELNENQLLLFISKLKKLRNHSTHNEL